MCIEPMGFVVISSEKSFNFWYKKIPSALKSGAILMERFRHRPNVQKVYCSRSPNPVEIFSNMWSFFYLTNISCPF